MKKGFKITAIVLVAILVLGSVVMIGGGVTPLAFGMHNQVFSTDDVAIQGYDAVAYHTESSAIKGDQQYMLEWKDSQWLFASAENKALFEANPEAYAPQCGGYCVFAVAKGFAAPGNPESWSIENGQLFFYSDESVKQEVLNNFNDIKKSTQENWK